MSPDLISAVIDAVLEEAGKWQNRPLDLCYPLVFFDAITNDKSALTVSESGR